MPISLFLCTFAFPLPCQLLRADSHHQTQIQEWCCNGETCRFEYGSSWEAYRKEINFKLQGERVKQRWQHIPHTHTHMHLPTHTQERPTPPLPTLRPTHTHTERAERKETKKRKGKEKRYIMEWKMEERKELPPFRGATSNKLLTATVSSFV